MLNSRPLIKLLGWFLFLLLLAPVAVSAEEGSRDFSREELAQMLAPVALYPDALLSQVLMAATYPLEVVEADRWVKRNPLLAGDNLDLALRNQDWDASVKGLCHVPAILGLMSERLDETTRLGDAFLAQEDEVMDTIQALRASAMREGNLKSDGKQKVSVREDGTIVIEPADPETVYLPYYNTRYVYGPWWYPAWPPWYWGPDEVVLGGGVYFWPDFYFGFGVGYWSYFDWPRHTIIIDVRHRPRFFRPDYDWGSQDGGWHHEPSHRRGAVYRDRDIAERFAQPPARVKQAEQQSTRSNVVRGPLTASGVKPAGTAAPSRPAPVTQAPERRRAVPAQAPVAVGTKGGGPERPGPQVDSRRRNEVARPSVEVAPRVEPARPAPVRRERSSEVSRETPRTPEVAPSREIETGVSGGSGYERHGGAERENRPPNPRERDGGSPENEQAREWGGRR